MTVCLRGEKATSVLSRDLGAPGARPSENYYSLVPRTMADDIEQPPRGYNTDDVKALPDEKPAARRRRLSGWKLFVVALIVIPGLVLALWTWVALGWAY